MSDDGQRGLPSGGPLAGILILDVSIWQNGPFTSVLLSDMGADVIKVETPLTGDPGRGLVDRTGFGEISTYFEAMNRNKRSITLDLKKPEAREIFYRLVEKADVVVQNFRVGVSKKLGIDYDTLAQHNPKIITASATGFGREGPDATNGCFDLLGVARSGTLRALQYPNSGPEYNGTFGLGDQTGAMTLAHAITMALLARERFGVGQDVEVSQMGAQFVLQQLGIIRYLITRQQLTPSDRRHAFNPIFSLYACEGGKWLALACLQADRYWHDICEVLELGELERDPRFAEMLVRNENGPELVTILDRVFASQPREHWLQEFALRKIPCAPVNDYADLVEDVQTVANDYLVEVEHPVLGKIQEVGVPIKMSKTPGSVKQCAPELGQHTEEVLMELGLDWDEIQELREAGAI